MKIKIIFLWILGFCLFSTVANAQFNDDSAPSYSNPSPQGQLPQDNTTDKRGYSIPDYQPQKPQGLDPNSSYIRDENGNLTATGNMVYDPAKVANCSNSKPGEVCSPRGKLLEDEPDRYENDENSQAKRSIASTDDTDVQCDTDFSSAKTFCSGNSLGATQLGPQINTLTQTFQTQQSAGNTKEACEAAAKLNAITAGMNSGFAVTCANAINTCMSSCPSDSLQYTQCQNLALNAKLSALQATQNAQGYVQSQACANIAAGSPGQNTLVAAGNKIQAANLQANYQNSPTKDESKIINGIDSSAASYDSTEKNIAETRAQNNTATGSTGFAHGSGSSSAIGSANQIRADEKQNKESNRVGFSAGFSGGNYYGGGGRGGYGNFSTKGYADNLPKPTNWIEKLKSFLPESEDEKINRNISNYYRNLRAEVERKQNSAHTNYRTTKKSDLTMIDEARDPASEESSDFGLKQICLISLSFLVLIGIIFYFRKERGT